MKIFVTGATGYIGGSVAAQLLADGHQVSGLVRSAESAGAVAARGIAPVRGSLDDADVLAALAGSGKTFVHTSGSSIVGTRAGGKLVDAVFDEVAPFTPSPARAGRVAIDTMVKAAANDGVRTAVICPSLIYGRGRGLNPKSIQLPRLMAAARKFGVAKHIGPGENRWSNVHIDDLVTLYMLAIEKAPAGSFYFAENGENSMREVCEAISRMLGFGGRTQDMTIAEAAAEWGEGPANDSMGSNSRVRAVRARAELGWKPAAPSLLWEIERGCYAGAG
jgi:nucleoside-diphosphate-sugar epimerase